jgi:hypothetical protein
VSHFQYNSCTCEDLNAPCCDVFTLSACRLVQLQPKYYKPKSSDHNDPNEPSPLFGPTHIVELYTELISEGIGGR